jgi:predicted ATP-grasp superfamily ATP-dependent carboligase
LTAAIEGVAAHDLEGAAVWWLRDKRLVRVEFHLDRAVALWAGHAPLELAPGARPSRNVGPMRALILDDGLSRQALAAARGLHAGGWEVGVGGPIRGIAARSRSVSRWHRVSAPEADLSQFCEQVRGVVRREGYEVVFGARDADVIALSQLREEIDAVIPYPRHDRVLLAFDKRSLISMADAAGLAVPRTVAGGAVLDDLSGPVIVKPRMHPRLGRPGAHARMEVQLARTSIDAVQRIAEIRAAGGAPILQEPIGGQLMSLAMVTDRHGNVIARLQQVTEMIYPVVAGVSVRARTTAIDEDLAKRCQLLLAGINWTGLAQIQFMVSPDALPRVIDFNGRFYGSLALGLAAGVNLAALAASVATGRATDEGGDARPGVRYQWLWGDLLRAFDERRGGLARDLVDTTRYARQATHSVWRLDDPRPATRYLRLMLGRGIGRRLPWTRSQRSTR